MIIKSMARKSPSFGQLINYFHKEAFWKKAPTYSHNMWETHSPDRIAEEFEQNATFLPKRSNGNYLYHECIALGHHPDVSTAKQERILLDLVERYVKLRCPDQMVHGRMHLDTDYYHFHLCISANTVRGKQRRWLSRSTFDGIQREMEKYKISKYPELGTEKYYDHEAKKKRREQAKAERDKSNKVDKAKLSRQEYELKKRSGKRSQKEQDRIAILDIFETALSELELTHRLAQLGFKTYVRGKSEGVVKIATGRKYRLKTLGLETALQTAKRRIRIFEDRRADMTMEQAKPRDKDKSRDEGADARQNNEQNRSRGFNDDNGRER